MTITAPYAEIAPTVADLKALTPELRCPNHCLFVPSLGSWVYYSATSTTAANDTTIFEPNDGLGRWIVTNQPTAPSGGSSGGSGITQQPGIDPAVATLIDLQRVTNQILSTLTAAGITTAVGFTRNYDAANPTRDLIHLLGTNGDSTTFANPHPAKITNSASSVPNGTVAMLTDRAFSSFNTNDSANSWAQIYFGAERTVKLSGIGLQHYSAINTHSIVNAIIEGSNDGATFTQIFQWNNIGFTAPNQEKFVTFAESPSYRYIRIRQPGINTAGTNHLCLGEVYLYGTLSVL